MLHVYMQIPAISRTTVVTAKNKQNMYHEHYNNVLHLPGVIKIASTVVVFLDKSELF